MQMQIIYGISKEIGIFSDRKHIAKELSLKIEHLVTGKVVDIGGYCPTWFVLKKSNRRLVDLDAFVINDAIMEELGKDCGLLCRIVEKINELIFGNKNIGETIKVYKYTCIDDVNGEHYYLSDCCNHHIIILSSVDNFNLCRCVERESGIGSCCKKGIEFILPDSWFEENKRIKEREEKKEEQEEELTLLEKLRRIQLVKEREAKCQNTNY